MVRCRVRFRFCKQGDLRWIGHRDLMRCLERLFRRAALPLGLSEGFHPKPRMTFPLALAVGIEGTDEVMELELAEPMTAEQLIARWTAHAPAGLVVRSAEVLPPGGKKARVQSAGYLAPIPPRLQAGLPERIRGLLGSSSVPIRRRPRGNLVDLRKSLLELSLQEGVLSMRLRTAGESCAGPRDVLSALGLPSLEEDGVCLTRACVEVCP
jgi:radical SAM-linked protein